MKKLPYSLGIDIGTSSIAAFAFTHLDSDPGTPHAVLAFDEYIFGEAVEPGKFVLSNEIRRTKRLMRRQGSRKKARIAQILHLGKLLDITPLSLKQAQQAEGSTLAVWQLRTRALDEKVSLDALWLIALRMSKNRGYKGDSPSSSKSKVASGIRQIKELQGSHRTVAEALVKRENQTGQSRYRKLAHEGKGTDLISGTFILRKDVEAEFDLILEQQLRHHPSLSDSLLDKFGEEGKKLLRSGSNYFQGFQPQNLAQALRHVIFYQRPLPSFESRIGRCSYNLEEKRVGTAHPAFQRFRIAKLLSDLRWIMGRAKTPLSPDQLQVIRAQLLQTSELSFASLYEALEDHDCPKPEGARLNFHTARTPSLKGDQTSQVIRGLKLLGPWEALTEQHRHAVIETLTDDLPSPERWATEQVQQETEQLRGAQVIEFLNRLPQTDDGGLKRLAGYGFSGGRARYGVTACLKLAAWLEEHCHDATLLETKNTEDAAIKAIYGKTASEQPVITGKLLDLSFLEITSPVVKRALSESHRFLKAFFARHGTPTRIVIELMREMRQTLEQRKITSLYQARNEGTRTKAKSELTKLGYDASNTNLKRYLLWQEQAQTCPYSGQRISAEDALDGSRTNFEHVLPKKLHGVGNRVDGLVLAFANFNVMKGEETPWAAAQLPGNLVRWDWNATVQACKSIAKSKSDFSRKAAMIINPISAADAQEDLDGFVDQQFSDTAWIGREIHRWVRQVTSDVSVVRGGLTASLRHQWGFDSILEEVRTLEGKHAKSKANELFYTKRHDGTLAFDKRCDHRHHIVDAAVIALSTRQLYSQEIKRRSDRLRHSSNALPRITPVPCPILNLREVLVQALQHYVVWKKPDRLISGKMFDEEPFRLLAEDRLQKRGEIVKKKFNHLVDKQIIHTDRHGTAHHKVILKAEAACIRITKDEWRVISLAQFEKEKYIKLGKLCIPDGEKLVFKDDIVYLEHRAAFYRVAQLKDDGIACVETSETATYDELKGTGLNVMVGDLNKLQVMKILRDKHSLATLISSLRNAS
jgi:CRISPR-associated endonuclease Csn1